METDVLILGGGPAGLAAAFEVASCGYRVTIVDEAWALGGQLRQQTQEINPLPKPFSGLRGYQLAEELITRLREFEIDYLLKHEFIGMYADGSAGVSNGEEIVKISPKCVIVATGAAETAHPFPGWTLPGIMTIGASQILINRERVYPGKTAIIFGSSDMALEITKQMADVGIEVKALVEPMEKMLAQKEIPLKAFKETGIPVLLNSKVKAVTGSGRVEKAFITTGNGQDEEIEFPVDLLCIDSGRHPIIEAFSILNCELKYNKELGGWLPHYNHRLQTTVSAIFAAGQAAGIANQAGVVITGSLAGIGAVNYLEKGIPLEREAREQEYWDELERIESEETPEIWRARISHME